MADQRTQPAGHRPVVRRTSGGPALPRPESNIRALPVPPRLVPPLTTRRRISARALWIGIVALVVLAGAIVMVSWYASGHHNAAPAKQVTEVAPTSAPSGSATASGAASKHVPTASQWIVVPGNATVDADGLAVVLCDTPGKHGYWFYAAPGQQVTCTNGALPRLKG